MIILNTFVFQKKTEVENMQMRMLEEKRAMTCEQEKIGGEFSNVKTGNGSKL